MFRPRVIPVLLLRNDALVKTRQFGKFEYIGDPINAVKIFNDLRADELVFLDILATRNNRLISLDFVQDVGDEANMPFSVGGGIKSIEHIRSILNAGAEKVVITSAAVEDPDFITRAADTFGSSTVVVGMDVKKQVFGKLQAWSTSGTRGSGYSPVDFARLMQDKGAGEIIIQSIARDGMRQGYDLELLRSISESVTIPVVALGGAGTLRDLEKAYTEGRATAVAAGSLFVFHGSKRGVLINYPERSQLQFS